MSDIKRPGRVISRREVTRIVVALGVVITLMLGCGGPPDGVVSEADEFVTIAQASASKFKLCKIVSDRFCQSPDGTLVFHMPADVLTRFDDNLVVDNILVTNESDDEVVINEYYIALTDNKGNFYRPEHFESGVGDLSEKASGAIVLAPEGRKEVFFSQRLKPEASGVTSVSIFYRLEDAQDFTQIVVSYRPQSLYDIK